MALERTKRTQEREGGREGLKGAEAFTNFAPSGKE